MHDLIPKQGLLIVDIGVHVEVELLPEDGSSEVLEFDLVEDRCADFAHGFLGAGTPLAKTIMGHTTGELLPYQADDIQQVRITAITPPQQAPPMDVEARRKAVIDAVIKQSNRIDALIFASSFNGKWGDYDPSSIDENW
jgi:hypothetical protein